LENQIRLAKLPAGGELGRLGQRRGRSFGRAGGGPFGDGPDFLAGEAALALKRAIAGLGKPRRHVAAGGDGGHLRGALFGVGVGEQRKRAGLAGAVAAGTGAVQNGRDVMGEVRRFGGAQARHRDQQRDAEGKKAFHGNNHQFSTLAAGSYNSAEMFSAPRAGGCSAEETRATIEAFLKQAKQPALLEPGEELLPLTGENFELDLRGTRLTLQAWDRNRNFARRVLSVAESSAARLELTIERFAHRQGRLFLLDLARRAGAEAGRRSGRLVFRERFRLFLRRQFPEWNLAELSAEANLEFSLSPAYPRAFLKEGQHGWAALACPPEGDAGAAVTFGLIWLDYLRAREKRVTIEGLALYVPAGGERAAALRLLCLNPATARFELFTYTAEDFVVPADPRDYGNLDTRLEPCRRPDPNQAGAWLRIAQLPFVESIPKADGRLSLRVHGMEFAELAGSELRFGLEERRPAGPRDMAEIERLAEELAGARLPDSADHEHPLYRRAPEAWLESEVRRQIEIVDASLLPDPIYDQVPAFAGGAHGILDLLAIDRSGRLAVLELKATADPNLPLQALDYWIRVKWHLDRGEFAAHGYFPGLALRGDPPRLLLVAPSLEFHPTTEALLSYFSPAIEVERIGLAVEWRKGLRIMFRLRGAQRPA